MPLLPSQQQMGRVLKPLLQPLLLHALSQKQSSRHMSRMVKLKPSSTTLSIHWRVVSADGYTGERVFLLDLILW